MVCVALRRHAWGLAVVAETSCLAWECLYSEQPQDIDISVSLKSIL